ncbi:hypothetical protein QYE76_024777 [Lolium multiflorum]|uniref:Uncharacterized protein n=1 Tax=Lolium multiflorum TaxID=4521 RepID=A0AAD8RD15_LOLMU|nr:hypothetical protein QYE76_024777 [Lolium multiflorum]
MSRCYRSYSTSSAACDVLCSSFTSGFGMRRRRRASLLTPAAAAATPHVDGCRRLLLDLPFGDGVGRRPILSLFFALSLVDFKRGVVVVDAHVGSTLLGGELSPPGLDGVPPLVEHAAAGAQCVHAIFRPPLLGSRMSGGTGYRAWYNAHASPR